MDNKPTQQTENFYFSLFLVRISSRINWDKIKNYKQFKQCILEHPIFEGEILNKETSNFLKYYYKFINQ